MEWSDTDFSLILGVFYGQTGGRHCILPLTGSLVDSRDPKSRVPVPFCPRMRLIGHCRGMLGRDLESDSGGHPIRSEGGRNNVNAEILCR